jgi:hypothetical protein
MGLTDSEINELCETLKKTDRMIEEIKSAGKLKGKKAIETQKIMRQLVKLRKDTAKTLQEAFDLEDDDISPPEPEEESVDPSCWNLGRSIGSITSYSEFFSTGSEEGSLLDDDDDDKEELDWWQK